MTELRERVAALDSGRRAALIRQLRDRRTVSYEPGQYDIAVLGGGMAGLTLALQVLGARPGTRVVVLERQEHPVPETAFKVGESTVEIAARYLRDVLDLEDHLDRAQVRKFGLRMFFSAGQNLDIARRSEVGATEFPPLRTYQLDRGRLENELWRRAEARGAVLVAPATVRAIHLRPDHEFHLVRAVGAAGTTEIQARWVVDASGRTSLLRRRLALAERVGHRANAVWFRVARPIDVKGWTDDAEWQARVPGGDRALSTNHLMGDGYWVWLIRLAGGATSVGIVTDASTHDLEEMTTFERALVWLGEHEPQLAAVLRACPEALCDFRVMRDYSYGTKQAFSGDRWALVGEAAVSLDPLYSPGGDLLSIGNGLAADLVTRSLDGEQVQALARVHDQLFLRICKIWLGIYERQYSLMGNAQIMTAKIIWDTAFYWGVFGLLYFHDQFRKITDNPATADSLSRVAALSDRVQAFFREWYAVAPRLEDGRFVDLYSPLEFMVRLHTGMAAGLDDKQLSEQFARNVDLFERIAGMIAANVIESFVTRLDDEAVVAAIQRWQSDPYLVSLINRHRRQAKASPIQTDWVMPREPVAAALQG